MTQTEMWKARCRQYAAFVESHHRCPSKHYAEERSLHSWWKHTRKLLNAGKLGPDRIDDFKKLIALAEANRHVNQYL